MAPQELLNNAVRQIPHDPRAIDRGITLRDSKYVPCMMLGLFGTGIVAIVFTFVSMTRTYQHLGGFRVCAILFTVVMGIAVALFTLVDALYAWGIIGMRDGDMPPKLLSVMRRYCTDHYIRPRVYYDDRVVRNISGVWTLRVLVPGLYAMALVVIWGINGAHEASPDTPEGTRFVMGNVFLAALCFLLVRTITSNIYSLNRKWDYVPDTIEDPPGTAPAAQGRTRYNSDKRK